MQQYTLKESRATLNYTDILLKLGSGTVAVISYLHNDPDDYQRRLRNITNLKNLLEREEVYTLEDWNNKIVKATEGNMYNLKYPLVGIKFICTFSQAEPNLPRNIYQQPA